MGLFFKRNLGGKNISFKKRVADSAISNSYIRETIKKSRSKFALGKSGAAKRTERDIIKAQAGGLDLKETHEIIQKRIAAGDITKEKAKKLAIEWGLTEERFHKFKDISECKNIQKRQEWMEKAQKKSNTQKNGPANAQNSPPKGFSARTNLNKSAVFPANIDSQPALKIASQRKLANLETQNNEEPVKPKNIWEIINKQKHRDAFPEDSQKTA